MERSGSFVQPSSATCGPTSDPRPPPHGTVAGAAASAWPQPVAACHTETKRQPPMRQARGGRESVVLQLRGNLVVQDLGPVDFGSGQRQLPPEGLERRVRHGLVVFRDGSLHARGRGRGRSAPPPHEPQGPTVLTWYSFSASSTICTNSLAACCSFCKTGTAPHGTLQHSFLSCPTRGPHTRPPHGENMRPSASVLWTGKSLIGP